jgi:hypothetical protein
MTSQFWSLRSSTFYFGLRRRFAGNELTTTIMHRLTLKSSVKSNKWPSSFRHFILFSSLWCGPLPKFPDYLILNYSQSFCAFLHPSQQAYKRRFSFSDSMLMAREQHIVCNVSNNSILIIDSDKNPTHISKSSTLHRALHFSNVLLNILDPRV